MTHGWSATQPLTLDSDCCINSSIVAMHLLPQSFVFQATQSSSQGAPDGTAALSSQSLFITFEKPAAPPPAAGFFVSP
jgi:hypothetical protein